MAEKILLETEAASIGGGGGAVDKKCCTKSRAVALGCKVDGSYVDNQLIPQGSASKAKTKIKCTAYGSLIARKSGSRFNITLYVDYKFDETLYLYSEYGEGGYHVWTIKPSDWKASSGGEYVFSSYAEESFTSMEPGTYNLSNISIANDNYDLDVTYINA